MKFLKLNEEQNLKKLKKLIGIFFNIYFYKRNLTKIWHPDKNDSPEA